MHSPRVSQERSTLLRGLCNMQQTTPHSSLGKSWRTHHSAPLQTSQLSHGAHTPLMEWSRPFPVPQHGPGDLPHLLTQEPQVTSQIVREQRGCSAADCRVLPFDSCAPPLPTPSFPLTHKSLLAPPPSTARKAPAFPPAGKAQHHTPALRAPLPKTEPRKVRTGKRPQAKADETTLPAL